MIWSHRGHTFVKPLYVRHTLLLLLLALTAAGVSAQKTQHIFIITTDGFRWQEVFSGADAQLINDSNRVKNIALTKQMFWDSTAELRRKKLMPFFWNVVAQEGQLYGNRVFGNKVGMRNLYAISYPGYNELLTGYADPLPNPNFSLNNRNLNILEFLNQTPAYKGKVVAFGSWRVFPYILNEKRSGIPVNSGYEKLADADTTDEIINRLEEEVTHKGHTRYDLLTFAAAKEYVLKNHPSVVFLGFGETDEAAHAGRYDLYLQDAAAFDRMLGELWYFVQTDPEYKDHTTFIITTDHGRGRDADKWFTHGPWAGGSGETWLACIGAGIRPEGEIRNEGQIYGKQVAATVGRLLGENFTTDRPVGKAIELPPPTAQSVLK